MELKQLKQIVKQCLDEDVKARNSDWQLYLDVCVKLGLNRYATLEDIVNNSKSYPAFESVSRARRNVQAKGENQAREAVRIERAKNQLKFKRSFA